MRTKSSTPSVVFSLDTTGSMAQVLRQLRRQFKDLVAELKASVPGIRLGFIAHGDDANRNEIYSIKVQDLATDFAALSRFIETCGDTYGGGPHANYERVLHVARELDWRADGPKVLVIVGDEVPHSPDFVNLDGQRLDWRNELNLLLQLGVNVYGVHCLPGMRPGSESFYRELARAGAGYYLTMDQFTIIPDLVRAVCFKQGGGKLLSEFESKVKASGRMNREFDQMFAVMLGRPVSDRFKHRELDAVAPGRFQVLYVASDTSIREFVEQNGLIFEKGRGFYQFTKTETIQPYKEVVLRDKRTGDFYSGDAARKRLGLPSASRSRVNARVKPGIDQDFDVFVQSTSVNRKLIAGTCFLYEVSDR